MEIDDIKIEFFRQFGEASYRGYANEQLAIIFNFFKPHIESQTKNTITVSDKEIKEHAFGSGSLETTDEMIGFIQGAKWMRELIDKKQQL